MKQLIKKSAIAITGGKKVVIVTPLRRIPELRAMLLATGMVSTVLTSHLTDSDRTTAMATARIIIGAPATINNINLEGYDVEYCWEEEMQGMYLDMLKAIPVRHSAAAV